MDSWSFTMHCTDSSPDAFTPHIGGKYSDGCCSMALLEQSVVLANTIRAQPASDDAGGGAGADDAATGNDGGSDGDDDTTAAGEMNATTSSASLAVKSASLVSSYALMMAVDWWGDKTARGHVVHRLAFACTMQLCCGCGEGG